jgi:hypothetical protein
MLKNKINKFIAVAIISEILYLSFYFIAPLKNLFQDHYITLKNSYLFIILISALLLLFYLYLQGFKAISKNNISTKTIIKIAIIFNLSLLFITPITSNDLYTYIYRSRIISVHHENPYIQPYNNLTHDKLYNTLNNDWSKNTNVYGPLFTMTGATITFIAKNSLFVSIFLFKFLFIILNIANIFLIKKISKSKKAVFLYAWNPFIIFEFAINGHNDVMQIFFILLGFTFFYQKNTIATFLKGTFFLSLSVFIKYISILLLPLYSIFVFHKLPAKNKYYFLFFSILLFLFLGVLLFLPFWSNSEIFNQLRNLANKESIFASLGILLIGSIFFHFNFSAPFYYSKLINKFTFIISYLIIVLKLLFTKNFYHKKRKSDLVFYSLLVFGILFLTFFNWLMPWYLSTFTVLAILQYGFTQDKKYFIISNISAIYGILFYILLR